MLRIHPAAAMLLVATLVLALLGFLYRPLPQAYATPPQDLQRIRDLARSYRRAALPQALRIYISGRCPISPLSPFCRGRDADAAAAAAAIFARGPLMIDSALAADGPARCATDDYASVRSAWRRDLATSQAILFLSGDVLSFSGFAALPDVDAWREHAMLAPAQLHPGLVRDSGLPAPVLEAIRPADAPTRWEAAPGVVSLWTSSPGGDQRWLYVRTQADREYLLFVWPPRLHCQQNGGWQAGLAAEEMRLACSSLQGVESELQRLAAQGLILMPMRDERELRRLAAAGLVELF